MATPTRKAVILSGPQASGKTTNAASLMVRHGCNQVIDEWAPPQPVVSGALHLTNLPVKDIPAEHQHLVVLYP